jgi:hypothetical protein
MPLTLDPNDRFETESGLRLFVQVPQARVQALLQAITDCAPLGWGDYDQVSFATCNGVQRFRSLGSGRNAATKAAVDVPCCELSFFLPDGEAQLETVLRAIYAAHPYEEPVIFVSPVMRTLHIRGQDEDNPNRFWNRESEDWVPEPHRG